ncbi:hypothetical protein ES703_86063 [subsurface metagenome]
MNGAIGYEWIEANGQEIKIGYFEAILLVKHDGENRHFGLRIPTGERFDSPELYAAFDTNRNGSFFAKKITEIKNRTETITGILSEEEKIKSMVRNFIEAIEKKDVDRALSFFAKDAAWVTPEGTFKGKKELRRYLIWLAQSTPNLTITQIKIGIMAEENKAVYEHLLKSAIEGMKWEVPVICVYEFSGEKIQYLRFVYDRLSMVNQIAKGWLAKSVVSSIIKLVEKGLR